VGGERHVPAAFASGKDLVPIVQEAGWAPALVRIVAGHLASPQTGVRSPDLSARSESLHRLSYRGPQIVYTNPVLQLYSCTVLKYAYEASGFNTVVIVSRRQTNRRRPTAACFHLHRSPTPSTLSI